MNHILIVGAGAYGHALKACLLSKSTNSVTLLNREGCQSFQEKITQFDFIIIAVPSQSLRNALVWIKAEYEKSILLDPTKTKINLISTAKGIEAQSVLLPHQIIQEVFQTYCNQKNTSCVSSAVLSGPSFAKEMMQGLPTCVVLASKDRKLLKKVSDCLHAPNFRIYVSKDILGVEIGGALKNVIAMVAGAVDGLKLGNNARAAVITRGLSEIAEIGTKMGANPLTFMGLSGLGDLILTCTGDLSRNRQFGYRLANGEDKTTLLQSLGGVVEGMATAQSAYHLAKNLDVQTSILMIAYRVLYQNLPITQALQSLLSGQQSTEFDWTRPNDDAAS